jgi:hypothetical protein
VHLGAADRPVGAVRLGDDREGASAPRVLGRALGEAVDDEVERVAQRPAQRQPEDPGERRDGGRQARDGRERRGRDALADRPDVDVARRGDDLAARVPRDDLLAERAGEGEALAGSS